MHTIGSIYYTLGNLIIIYGLTAAGNPWTGKLLFNPVVLESSSMEMNSTELFRVQDDNYFILSKQYVDNFSRVYFHTSVDK